MPQYRGEPDNIQQPATVFIHNEGVFDVLESTIEFNHSKTIWDGYLHLESLTDNNTTKYSGEEVARLVQEGNLYIIPSKVEDNPEQILLLFASLQLTRVVCEEGLATQYNRIGPVEEVGDLVAAERLTHTQIDKSTTSPV